MVLDSSRPNSSSNTNTNTNCSSNFRSNIKSTPNYHKNRTPILYSTIILGAYDLSEIAELIKEEANGSVILEPDKNTMKCRMELKQGALSFDVENSIAPLLGFGKIL